MTLTDEQLGLHLRRLEESLQDAAVRRDRGQVAALLADDFEEIGASGMVWTREQILDLLAREDYQRPAMEDFNWRRIADGVVRVTYRTARSDPRTGERAAVLRSSLWTDQGGVWRVRFHQGTRVP